MFIFSHIIPFYFLSALFAGLLYVYITTPLPDIIVKYPTPDTSPKMIFEDDADNCYKFNTVEVSCPSDKSQINEIPIQRKIETFRNKRTCSSM
jgi:hypothetical protein